MSWEDDLDRGNALADRGDHERAIAAFRDAESNGGPNFGLNIGNSFRALGETAEARDAFASAWAEGDRDAGFNLGSLLESIGDASALGVYTELAESGYVKAAVNGAGMLLDAGRYEDAARLLSEHVDDPTWGDVVRATLGTAYWRAGHGDAAEPLLRQAAQADAHARADLGHLLLDSGRRDEAVQEWEKGVADSQPESMIPLANLISREGDGATAAHLYERAYELGDAHAALNLALDLHRAGRHREAMGWARKAAELGDERAEAWLDDFPESGRGLGDDRRIGGRPE